MKCEDTLEGKDSFCCFSRITYLGQKKKGVTTTRMMTNMGKSPPTLVVVVCLRVYACAAETMSQSRWKYRDMVVTFSNSMYLDASCVSFIQSRAL